MNARATGFVAALAACWAALAGACDTRDAPLLQADAGGEAENDAGLDPNACAVCERTVAQECTLWSEPTPTKPARACPPDLDSPSFASWVDGQVAQNRSRVRYSCISMPSCPEYVLFGMGEGKDSETMMAFEVATKKLRAIQVVGNYRATCLAEDGCVPNRCLYAIYTATSGHPSACPSLPYPNGFTPQCTPFGAVVPSPPDPAYHAPRIQPACSDAQVSDFYDACEGASASSAACQAWRGAAPNVACSACLRTPASDPAWGATVELSGGETAINSAGCLAAALSEGSATSGCGAARWALDRCLALACPPARCAIDPRNPTRAEAASYDQCIAAAIDFGAPCEALGTDAASKCGTGPVDAAAPRSRCPLVAGVRPEKSAAIATMATLCGGSAADAGAD